MGRLRSQTGSVLRSLAERRRSGWNGVVAGPRRQPNGVNALASEHKATRVLAVVFICFFICWTPFFLTNFTQGFCGTDLCSVPAWISAIFLWLGYLSSTINPIIYTIFNRRFRQAFLKILRGELLMAIWQNTNFNCCFSNNKNSLQKLNEKRQFGSGDKSGSTDYYNTYSKTHKFPASNISSW